MHTPIVALLIVLVLAVAALSVLAAKLKPRDGALDKPRPLEVKRQLLTERERALYQRLVAAGAEQEGVCRAVEEAFLEGGDGGGGGVATEREVAEFVRTLREARVLAYLRRERKERWDEGRVGGWRG